MVRFAAFFTLSVRYVLSLVLQKFLIEARRKEEDLKLDALGPETSTHFHPHIKTSDQDAKREPKSHGQYKNISPVTQNLYLHIVCLKYKKCSIVC